MSRLGLIILVSLTAMSTIGCGKDKKSKEEQARACMWDPTGECQRKVRDAMEKNPEVAKAVSDAMKEDPKLVEKIGSGVKISSVDRDAIMRHAAKVEAAIEADRMNPDSYHYDPPVNRDIASSGDEPPKSSAPVLPASSQEPAAAVPAEVVSPFLGSSSGGGETIQ